MNEAWNVIIVEECFRPATARSVAVQNVKYCVILINEA